MSSVYTLDLNRIHRLSLWCQDCNNYWQVPNHLVVLHGTVDCNLFKRLLKINFYLYRGLFGIEENYFGESYDFDNEIAIVFNEIKEKIEKQCKEIKVLDVDIVSYITEKMPDFIHLIQSMKSAFDTMAFKVLEYSSKSFITKLGILKKNIMKSLETDNVKCALDSLMDLNISGFDFLVQTICTIFNSFYILNIEICEPETKKPGVVYCTDHGVIIERLLNLSTQNFLYKHKRRWLIFYREILDDCKTLFGSDIKKYNELRQCGNFEIIENTLFDLLILKNTELFKQLTVIRYDEQYPKQAKDIYEWWTGRSKEQIQKILNSLDDCLTMEKKTSLLPFILYRKDNVKDRIYYDVLNLMRIFRQINPEFINLTNFLLRIYPEVYEQVYFPDRERYISLNKMSTIGKKEDQLDSIRNKNVLRKCENVKCQERNNGKNVIWNLNAFELEKHSMNTIFVEFTKNPEIFENLSAFIRKNFNVNVNSKNLIKKIPKILYK